MKIGLFFDLFLIMYVNLLITGKVAQCKQEWYMSSRPWYKIYIFVDLGCSSKPLSSCHICGPFSLPLGQPVLPLVQTFASAFWIKCNSKLYCIFVFCRYGLTTKGRTWALMKNRVVTIQENVVLFYLSDPNTNSSYSCYSVPVQDTCMYS